MLLELLKKNRSYRSFDESRKISESELIELIEYSRFAPSSINLQPLKYRLVFSEKETAEVQEQTKWAGLIKDMELPPQNHRPTAFIIICHDLDISKNKDSFMKDVGLSAQTILLAASEKGLGGCMIGSFDKESLVKILSLSQNLVPVLVIAIGKPDEEIIIEDSQNGNVTYYRKDGTHHVPKRTANELIIK